MAKASKDEARYRNGPPHRRCRFCTMFRPPHDCTAVAGEIEASGLCNYFKRKRGKLYTHPSSQKD